MRRAILDDQRTWFALYALVVLIATSICVGRVCNNFLIFRAATDHLVAGRDLYAWYPAEHFDLYKYSPTFALAFAPFARLPFDPALLLWNAANILPIFLGLRLVLPAHQQLTALQLTGIGLITTVDGTQSNGLVAALMLFAFAAYERGRLVAGATAIAGGAFVKVFPLALLALLLPRRDRWRAGAIFGVVFVALLVAPLIVTDPATLVTQYRSWFAMGSVDALDRGASVMRLLAELADYDGRNWPIQLAGTVIVLLPLVLRPGRWSRPEFRHQFLASLLVYSVIFNHKAEQPSFTIALVGVAIWYAIGPRTLGRTTMAAAAFLATVPILAAVADPTIFPDGVMAPLRLTVAACTLVWVRQQADLLDLLPVSRPMPEPELSA